MIGNTEKSAWLPLYGQKAGTNDQMSDEPIGKINIESNFFENSSAGESSEGNSQDEDLKQLEK